MGNEVLDGVLENHPGEYSLVKYQMDWPGDGDPYYIETSAIRKDYYEVTGVPHLRTNGFSPGYPQSYTDGLFTDLADMTNISISVEASVDEAMLVTSHVEITAHAEYANGLRAYAIVVESTTFDNETTNGEKEFHNVVQGYLTSSEGIQLGALTTDQVLTYDLSIDLSDSFTETGNDLKVIVFVQNHSTKGVEQSEMVDVAHPFADYSVTFNVRDVDYNKVGDGQVIIEKGGKARITDSEGTVSKLLPGTYYYNITIPGLLPYDGEVYVTDTDVVVDVIIDIPPFLFYEDFEAGVIPEGWTVSNPVEDYFANFGGRIVYQKMGDDDTPVYFMLPKIELDQGCVVSFKAGESSGPSDIAVGVVSDPSNPDATYTEVISHEIFLLENMQGFSARIGDAAMVGDGNICFKILGGGGSFFYLDNVIIIENMPGYKVQFIVTDQNSEVLPEVEVTFMDEAMATNDYGYATWRDIDEAEYAYSVTYKGEEIESGTIDVWDDTVKEISWNTTGIDQVNKESIEIYPNPATDQFTIKGVYNGRLSIVDLEGRVLKNMTITSDTNVQISDLNDGIYFVRIESEDKTKITKLVKTR